jgi:hypothetical protein
MEVWEQAEPVDRVRSKRVFSAGRRVRYVTHGGRQYPVRGDSLYSTELSPYGRYLAVDSYTMKGTRWFGLVTPFDSGERTVGPSFTDVYDTTTGRLVLAARTPDSDPIGGWGERSWAGDRCFLETEGRWSEGCRLIVFPEPNAKQEGMP